MRLWSANPSKRWTEQLVLAYSPIWIAAIGACQVTHIFTRWGDLGHLAFGLSLALPLWLVPLVWPSDADRELPLAQRHAVRFAVFIAAWTGLQVYFGSDLFFDVLGMQYHFNVHWLLHRTPVFLYFVTIAYFSTYYVVMQILWRAFRTRWPDAPAALRLAALLAIGYATAFAETAGMATDAMRDYFSYRDKRFVLLFGSLAYGSIFAITLPLVYRLDETRQPDGKRTLGSLVWDACAANSIVLVVYALFAAVAGR
jgi:cycloeucalenol cycloisomerase